MSPTHQTEDSLPFDIAIVGLGIVGIHQITREVEETIRRCGHTFVVDSGFGVVPYLEGICPEVTSLFSFNEKELRTAMSLGYVRSDGKTSFNDLQERAEIACQHAKTRGNETVIEWTEDLKHDPLVRIGGRCRKCDARITCSMPKKKAPAVLNFCPCCGESI